LATTPLRKERRRTGGWSLRFLSKYYLNNRKIPKRCFGIFFGILAPGNLGIREWNPGCLESKIPTPECSDSQIPRFQCILLHDQQTQFPRQLPSRRYRRTRNFCLQPSPFCPSNRNRATAAHDRRCSAYYG
jgi:hypothetical protein